MTRVIISRYTKLLKKDSDTTDRSSSLLTIFCNTLYISKTSALVSNWLHIWHGVLCWFTVDLHCCRETETSTLNSAPTCWWRSCWRSTEDPAVGHKQRVNIQAKPLRSLRISSSFIHNNKSMKLLLNTSDIYIWTSALTAWICQNLQFLSDWMKYLSDISASRGKWLNKLLISCIAGNNIKVNISHKFKFTKLDDPVV